MTDQQGGGEKLHGWKEIASHFDRTPRTVQRWEREFGLPVHRLGLGKAEVVYAVRTELEAWERQRAALPSTEVAPEGAKAAPADEPPAVAPPRSENSPPPTARGRRRRWWGRLALLSVLLGAVLLSWRLAIWHPGDRLQVATKAVVEAQTLRVLAAGGRELWSYRFEHPVEEDYYRSPPWYLSKPLQFEDLDGDGTRELLALAIYVDSRHGFDLLCFEADGRKRFTWAPSRSVSYAANTWGPPFRAQSALVTDGDGPKALWVNAVHHLYFPSVAAKLDRRGRVLSEFWTNGNANVLALGRVRGRQVLLAGCANNEWKRAGLVVIDAEHASGSTPATNPAYRCRDCPSGAPLASLVFPVPDLAARMAEGGIPAVMNLLPNDAGGLSVGIGYPLRRYLDRRETPLLGAFYEFDASLRPIRAEFTAQYVAAHRRAEKEGLIDHRFEARVEERQLFPILSWDGSGYVPTWPQR